MSRTRYHFLRIEEDRTVKHVVTLPGQTLGRLAVIPGILVKDVRGQTVVATARRKAVHGDVLFTTTLARKYGCYAAADIHRLDDNDDIFLQDAVEAYRELERSWGQADSPSAV